MAKALHKVKKHLFGFSNEVLKQLLVLSTGGFGLIAALAWNEAIKEAVNVYVKPFFGQGSGLFTLLIYAVFVTVLAVVITYSLTKLIGKKN